ncbi:dethiobiotin synthase [Aliiglaciecola sp. 2_MG-2023]|uniref:dethiobiotin synthase n=1 Tax=unclassified Aliiglaciecola TaxID=2593648 RepID=UPI0026E3DC53|nr:MULTISPECIES: dethiobiotin synthase [unclassified Aliiglaciecola]MDO6711630.1 dethiobiotin synthase [Aliiglaciecola sp. 2_MG-2023]MDO6752701.1 dethiobiotin synthase [Aliiglaciecola sp. 1_MG-2023]
MINSIFIAGTDTDAGKTVIGSAILQLAAKRGLSTIGFKPVSAGCFETAEGLRNDDAVALQRVSTLQLPYEKINPIAFADPVAPHLAAQRMGVTLDLQQITSAYTDLLSANADLLLTEGAGGWRLPLGEGAFLSDFAIQQKIPVVLVVGMKLGCLNHALLTYQAICADGLEVIGWVANQIDEQMLYLQDNIESLKQLIPAPCLGVVPKLKNTEQAAEYLSIDRLFQ